VGVVVVTTTLVVWWLIIFVAIPNFRGENIVSCWAMREVENKSDWCIFEWLLCLDLKGKIPRYVLDTVSNGDRNNYHFF
jgi:hypothetical protein